MSKKNVEDLEAEPVKGDWITTVKDDIEELDLNLTFEQNKAFTKETFQEKVKEHVKASALKYVQNLQQTHSKSKPLIYTKLEAQDYLKQAIPSRLYVITMFYTTQAYFEQNITYMSFI